MVAGLQRPTINKRSDRIHRFTLLARDHPRQARACADAFCSTGSNTPDENMPVKVAQAIK